MPRKKKVASLGDFDCSIEIGSIWSAPVKNGAHRFIKIKEIDPESRTALVLEVDILGNPVKGTTSWGLPNNMEFTVQLAWDIGGRELKMRPEWKLEVFHV